jgi:hypothetical protein
LPAKIYGARSARTEVHVERSMNGDERPNLNICYHRPAGRQVTDMPPGSARREGFGQT